MASLEGTQLWWNGKLTPSADLLYYDKINVDVVHPPYATRDRNSSYFLKTRRGYQADIDLYSAYRAFASDTDGLWNFTDIQIIWDSQCDRESGTVYYMGVNQAKSEKIIMTRKIVDGCVDMSSTKILNEKSGPHVFFQDCSCVDEKFFKTQFVKGKPRTTRVFKKDGQAVDEDDGIRGTKGVQINRIEGGAMRGYFWDEELKDGTKQFAYNVGSNPIQAGDYLLVYSSTNGEGDGFCGQVRTITGFTKDGMLMLDSAWSGFKDGEDEVRGKNLTYAIYSDWGDVLGFTSGRGVDIIMDDEQSIRMCDFGNLSNNADCIVASAATTDRVFFLYNNGWVHFGGVGRDKFFDSGDAMYVGTDKQNIYAYRDMLLALGRRSISVGVKDSTGSYFQMYEQSQSIGMKNRYAYGEYNGDLLFISNDNRLLALKFASNVGKNMLEFEDVGQYVNPYLKAMLPTDEAYIGVDNNKLRIFLISKSDIDDDNKNSRTLILKYDTIFTVWTVDQLKYFIIKGCYEGLYYGDAVYGRAGHRDIGAISYNKQRGYEDYQVKISAFLMENEDNGMSTTDATLDLFRLASLQKIILLLGMGRYDDSNTKLNITEYRNGFGYEYTIDSLNTNHWVYNAGAAYEGENVEISDCVKGDIRDNATAKRSKCASGHKIQKPIPQPIRCGYENDLQLTDHSVCIDDEVYKFAPTMPLTIPLGDQESFNSQIYVELEADCDDVITFGGFLCQLTLAPLGYKGADGEYMVEVVSGC